ncbi:MAG: acetyltransferase, partial [Desulfobulbaceae bacterium]|nr:acetyltransferase [Desulfobulbaceae bacterium]
LSYPRPDAQLVTGVKRDINLLAQLEDISDSSITVLDISLDRNREDLERLLALGNMIFYADHHFSGDIPESGQLEVHIDPAPQTCTSLIIDRLLDGKYRGWAVAGAFGDNLDESALKAARSMNLKDNEVQQLKEIGILLNYNGYGATLEDLFFPPDALFQQVRSFEDPFAFHASSKTLQTLRKGYQDDMTRAAGYQPIQKDSAGRAFLLPGESWSRRVAGVYSNTLARQQPDLAHALLMPNTDGSLRISVRAPLNNRIGADILCRQFPTGGGRTAAAGINELPENLKEEFLSAFSRRFAK